MRIALIGQRDLGRAVLEAFLERGDTVAGVFCAPERPGAPADALHAAARERGVPVNQFPSLASAAAEAAIRTLDVDLGVMADALQYASQAFVAAPTLGTIQFHPALLPRYRGPSALSWPILKGEAETGLTVCRPAEGYNEGPVILQRTYPIGPHDTRGDLERALLPLGVEALLEAADLILADEHVEIDQDEDAATYEGWFRGEQAEIRWASHAELIYNLIRAANPHPGAWTTLNGRMLRILDVRLHAVHRQGHVRGRPGEVVGIDGDGFCVCAQGGRIEVQTVRPEGGETVSAVAFARGGGIAVGSVLGT
ncbi:methionyl-tRNA formyltransferase [Methylobacterium sp. NEAU 140]|uniref:methionyl-tRNA formyltransferase n=1 Tax=Methylobacterium sp. NEAU 140 TaxID=3064945 RepID=UPI0027367249|nr:methionyl-tRNA formyltransferase [Methylobacterium sp. NEAU 140]MDP4021270.1 methionyl-tRNA formyltransferase [Methylobacterium sp. NEAU 140]